MLGHFYVFMSACIRFWERLLHRVFDILVCLLLSMILYHDATAGDSSPTARTRPWGAISHGTPARCRCAEFRVLQNDLSVRTSFAILATKTLPVPSPPSWGTWWCVGHHCSRTTMGLAGAVMMAFALSGDFGMNGLLPLGGVFLRARAAVYGSVKPSSGACRCRIWTKQEADTHAKRHNRRILFSHQLPRTPKIRVNLGFAFRRNQFMIHTRF